ncbi:MAG TPA: ribonuclease J [Clostridiales bacterium]|jgi:ribonuclease J|nr:ribonuclease J [Clostridiales bacterium]HOJ35998.1 ribonuclease J [Clostridiales bacterium]HOL78594.1 ribonuclease J [Clostridiales bacterium]HPP67830.1 ribonuclease J [Clostridiales bacterium]HQA06102.1 ribonuclease J [Clostridiales bacterium]
MQTTKIKKTTTSKKQSDMPLYSKRSPARKKATSEKGKPVKIAFLGGLNEIGKNMTLIEYDDDIIIIDCGLAFPDSDMLGVDLVIPDFTYVERNADKLKGVLITHGHEDHIGGLAFLLKTVKVPVYATKLSIGLIEGKLKEHKILEDAKLNVIKPGQKFKLGKFEIEAIHVNHSIPDSVSYAIKCDAGTILHTGDFKIDTTPIDGEVIDLSRFAELGKEGVLCMLSDSTNAEREGYSASESKVGDSFGNLFSKAGKRRLIIATFASNIHRIQQIIDVAHKTGRKVALSGRSIEYVVKISTELGYLNIPEGLLIGIEKINNYNDDQLVIITTGSQGEPMSALTRMAMSEHRKVDIGANDYVIISATPIPGNEKTVSKVINELIKLGAEVIYEKMHEVHVSGHAYQEELKLMMALVKPKYFIPIHGEQKHLRKHAALAELIGIPSENIVIADIGSQVEFLGDSMRVSTGIPAGRVFVDGYGVGDVGSIVLRDRKLLSQDGIIVISFVIDSVSREIISPPEITSRGFVYVRESEQLFSAASEQALHIAQRVLDNDSYDLNAVRTRVRDDIAKFMYEKTKRSPMVLPVILEV